MNRIVILLTVLLVGLMIIGCEKEVLIQEEIVPATPTGLFTVTGDREVRMIWQSNNDQGLTDGYGVYLSITDIDGPYELLTTITEDNWWQGDFNGDDVIRYTYVVTGLSNGTTYFFAVNAYNQYGETDLSVADIFDTPRPEGITTVWDFHNYPQTSGFDLSRGQVVHVDDVSADIFFEYDPNLETFFFFAVNEGVDIQSYGATADLNDLTWVPNIDLDSWSRVGWMELALDNTYIVWTADDHFGAFRVETMNPNNNSSSIVISWAYQPSESDLGWRELKLRPMSRPEHDDNYGNREVE